MIRAVACFLLLAVVLAAQTPAAGSEPNDTAWIDLTPEFVEKVTVAVDYRGRDDSARIALRGTPLMPRAEGEAKVEPKPGYVEIKAQFRYFKPAITLGPEYLTYVFWAVTPEGRTANLGEIKLLEGKGRLAVTTELMVFGLVVTAEPYFAVRQPSDVVVLENEVPPDSKQPLRIADVKYKLVPRGQYQRFANPLALTIDARVPLDLYEARNAVRIARATGAERHAPEMFLKAERRLGQAEAYQARSGDKKAVVLLAREAVEIAEQARDIAEIYGRQEQLARQRAEAAERTAAARAQAEAERQRRAAAEAERQRLEEAERLAREKAAKEEADRRRLEAELASAREAARRAEEEAQRAKALLREQTASYEEQRARWEQERSRRTPGGAAEFRHLAELEKAERRVRLYTQLGRVLPTRETDAGLVVEIPPDLFHNGGAELTVKGRERLALIAGILLSHPGLAYQARSLTEPSDRGVVTKRIDALRAYLGAQDIPEAAVSTGQEGPDIAGEQPVTGSLALVISGETIGLPSAAGR